MTRELRLTPDQEAAVNCRQDRVLLAAPAGSGKTEVLIRRMERLLQESPGSAFRLLSVTYTEKAASEIRSRIAVAMEGEAWRVDCHTLHALALDWLMRYGHAVDVGANVVVYADDTDRYAVLAKYLRSLGLHTHLGPDLRGTLGPVLSAIDRHRTVTPRESPSTDRVLPFGLPFVELFDAYRAELAREGGIDFPDMLTKFLELLEADTWVLGHFQRTYGHVLVDEGQDLTPVQAELLRVLTTGSRIAVFVVADQRQSINGFVGGSFANAEVVVGEGALRLTLSHNFRSAISVLATAERLASHLTSPPLETLAAPGAPRGNVYSRECTDPTAEAQVVADWVCQLLATGLDTSTLAVGEDPRVLAEEVGVVARARWLLDPLIDELGRRGERVSVSVEGSGFLKTAIGRCFVEALSVLSDARDRPAMRRLWEELHGLGYSGVASDPLTALRTIEAGAVQRAMRHLELAQGDSPDLDALLGRVVDDASSDEWRSDAETIEALWRRYRTEVTTQGRSIKGFLRFTARTQATRPSDPGVRALTIHKVKGLQFRAVAIIGAYDGAIPDYRAVSESDLDAERRSLYVAITRAQRALLITWPLVTVDRRGRQHAQAPSRFLREAGL